MFKKLINWVLRPNPNLLFKHGELPNAPSDMEDPFSKLHPGCGYQPEPDLHSDMGSPPLPIPKPRHMRPQSRHARPIPYPLNQKFITHYLDPAAKIIYERRLGIFTISRLFMEGIPFGLSAFDIFQDMYILYTVPLYEKDRIEITAYYNKFDSLSNHEGIPHYNMGFRRLKSDGIEVTTKRHP